MCVCVWIFNTILIWIGTEEVVDNTMKEAGASRAQIITIRRERNQTFLLDHHFIVSEVTDHASMIHEGKHVVQSIGFDHLVNYQMISIPVLHIVLL